MTTETCPNCGEDRRTTYVGDGNLICGACLLPVALWPWVRTMKDELDRLQNLLKFSNLHRGYMQEERDQLQNMLNLASLKNQQLRDELALCSNSCRNAQKGGAE